MSSNNINNNDIKEDIHSYIKNLSNKDNNNENSNNDNNNNNENIINNNIEIKKSLDNNISFKNSTLKNDMEDNIENNIKNDSIVLSSSMNNNPILIQLVEFGYNQIYAKRIIQYFHPQDIEEALDYLSSNEGIIQHRFVQDRNLNNNNNCYACGEIKEIHLGYNPENEAEDIKSNEISQNIKFDKDDNINNKNNSINLEDIKLDKDDCSQKIICEICSEAFFSTNENKVKTCGHSYCNSCWFDFLSIQIQENKISLIKCLNYECKEKLTDEFIINLLNNNVELINKYKKYKLELEILNNPNIKYCPFPNCDSYLELKDEKNKDVTCLNNHTFCFLCLQKPHGKLTCNTKFDNSIIEFTKNNFVKTCPNCGIITEKNAGCNHITCSKCKFQWCWLCNEEYKIGHFNEGKCKGFQYFKPNDEYEIKLAFEGKIQLRESQRQEEFDFDDNFIEIPDIHYNDHRNRERNIIRRYGCLKTFFIFFLYLIIGHAFYSLISMPNSYMRNAIVIILVCISYLFLEIVNFFSLFYFNLIMLFPYLINQGFFAFIHYCHEVDRYTILINIFYHVLLLILNIFFGSFFYMLCIKNKIINYTRESYIQKAIFIFITIIFLIIFFPLQFIINQIFLLILIIYEHSNIIGNLNRIAEKATGFSFNRNI